jgi:NitT/TauT family transport system ATP-binding protein
MIRFDRVSFGYTTGAPIFTDFSWQVGRGEPWAVTGASGCGKSTLLMLLAGLLQPAAGDICIEGEVLTRPRPQTGLIIQDYGLLPWSTVRQNASLGQDIRDLYGPDGKHAPRQPQPSADVDYWLGRLGLAAVAGQYPHQVSGGQRQRTAIARTLLLQPDLLLMDEPFSSLDAPTREGLQAFILDLLAEQQLTLVLVTHSIEEAALVGQKILVLSGPPNRKTVVLDNPGAAAGVGYRSSSEYSATCHEVRSLLETR